MAGVSNRIKLRAATLVSCALGLALAAPAHGGTVAPVSGDVSPLYGRINPFFGDVSATYGRINPFYGRINPFYGRINPFFGDVTSYWGRINPFTQSFDAATLQFYGTTIDPFWGATSPYRNSKVNYASLSTFWAVEFANWNALQTQWNGASTPLDATILASMLQGMVITPAANFWTPIIAQSGLPGTTSGKMIAAQLAASGVTFNADGSLNANSLLNVSPTDRAMLFLNVYDTLMDYAGTGHVDWWMAQVGWTPALALTQGKTPDGGVAPTVGMIDFAVTVSKGADGRKVKGPELSNQVVQYGSTVFDDGHGAAVGSLIMGAVDGSGVLGVMPAGSVKVSVYDPYDATGTTNWTEVGTGVATLVNAIFKDKPVPVGVLNASLGEPGFTLSPGWNDALANAGAHGHNLVIAAGNDGGTQTQDVAWNFATNPNLLIVGSVGADGTISNFSNRPGEACLLPTGTSVCAEANKLKYRFIVAPGELILVSDGLGGHMRQSGTSLAAPFVSGAIAMLQNRWPWLSKYPDETAAIILRSATPKGDNPGADAVYGAGELNIAASQAPLNWGSLVFYQAAGGKAGTTAIPLSTVIAQIKPGTQSSWNASNLYYSAIETIGATRRDFQIPLSSKLVGQNVTTSAGGQRYQSYLAAALRAQAGRFASLAPARADAPTFKSGFERSTVPVGLVGNATLRFDVAPAETGNAFAHQTVHYETNGALVTDGAALHFGFGNGAAALDDSAGFGFRSDYDLARGGANPLLGLASGGSYLGGRATLVPGLSIGFGTTERSARRNLAAFGLSRAGAGAWVDRYAARAEHVSLAYALSGRFTARAAITRLHETSALLGIQSLDPADFRGGATTDGASAGFDLAVGRTVTLSGTGTLARTAAGAGQIGARGLTSASAEFALVKARLFARSDELRLTLASPLHTIGGRLTYSAVGIADRDTGALGIITQSFSARSGSVPLAGEAIYGMALPGRAGEFSLFGRVDRDSEITRRNSMGYTGGAQMRLAF